MKYKLMIPVTLVALIQLAATRPGANPLAIEPLRVGAAAVTITPFGPNPDWDGTITENGTPESPSMMTPLTRRLIPARRVSMTVYTLQVSATIGLPPASTMIC